MYRCENDNRREPRERTRDRYGNLELKLRVNNLVDEIQLEKIVLCAQDVMEVETIQEDRDEDSDEEEEP